MGNVIAVFGGTTVDARSGGGMRKWISAKKKLPKEHRLVLCIVSGKPRSNITLYDAYQLGSWSKDDGWIIDEWPDWEDADVSWWMPLPDPPKE